MVKALSLWEPWASLVGTGAKTFETRSWSTRYRGPLLICSAKRRDRSSLELLKLPVFQVGLAPLLGDDRTPDMKVEIGDLRFGEAVTLVNLVDCIPMSMLPRGAILNEVPFGDYTLGRFAWRMEELRPLARGFAIKGMQGLFEIPEWS